MARWALIAGPKRSKKTEWALELTRALRRCGIGVGGFVQIKRRDDQDRLHYDLQHLASSRRTTLADEAVAVAPDEAVAFCSLQFHPSAFVLGQRWLEKDLPRSRVLILGDISKVEVGGDGHAESVHLALAQPDEVIVVLLIRADQLFYIVEKLELDEASLVSSLELPADEGECEEFITDLLEAANDGATALVER